MLRVFEMAKISISRTAIACVFGCLLYLFFVLLASAESEDVLDLPVPYQLPAAEEITASKGYKSSAESRLVFYTIGNFDWCSLPGYVLTIRFEPLSRLPDAVRIGQSVSKTDRSFIALPMHRILRRSFYVIDSCEIWTVLEDCSIPLSIMVGGGDLRVRLFASIRRASKVVQEEKPRGMSRKVAIQRFPVGLDITVGEEESCSYPKSGRFYWIKVPSVEGSPIPYCSTKFHNPGWTRAVYFHDPTKIVIDYRNEEYVSCGIKSTTQLSSTGSPALRTASPGSEQHGTISVVSKYSAAEQIRISEPYKVYEYSNEVVYEADGFDWCSRPGYVMTLRFHSLSQVPKSVLIAQKPSFKNVNLITVPMRHRVGFPAFVIDSCEIWGGLDDCLSPLLIMVADGNLGMTASLSIRRVSESLNRQKRTSGTQTFPVPRLPVGLGITVAKRASCSYPSKGRFYWMKDPHGGETVPYCIKNVANPGWTKALYFHDPTMTPLDYTPSEYVTCQSEETPNMHNKNGNVRRKREVASSPGKPVSSEFDILVTGPHKKESDHGTLLLYASGFNWCSSPGYILTLLLDYAPLEDGVEPKSVLVSLKEFPESLWGEVTVPMRAGPTMNRFTLESCELWSVMTYLSSCPKEIVITITGSSSINVAATLTAQLVSEARKVEDDSYDERDTRYPVQSASVGVTLNATGLEVCGYPLTGSFYWILSPDNEDRAPQCINGGANPGLTQAIYFHNTTEVLFDTRPDESVWCKKAIVEKRVDPVVVQHLYPWVQTHVITKGYWDTREGPNTVVYDVSGFKWCSLPSYAMFFIFHTKVNTGSMSVSVTLKNAAEPFTVAGVPMALKPAPVPYYTTKSCELWSLMKDAESCPQEIFIRVTGIKTLELRASLFIQRVVVATSSGPFTEVPFQKFPVGVEVMCSKPGSCSFPDSSRFYRIAPPSDKHIVPQCTQEFEGAGSFRAVYFQDFGKTEMSHFQELMHTETMQNDEAVVITGLKSATLSPTLDSTVMRQRLSGGPRHSLPTRSVAASPTSPVVQTPRLTTASGQRSTSSSTSSPPTAISPLTPEMVLRAGITAAGVSAWEETITYTFLLPFLNDDQSIRGTLGPYVLSFYLRGFLLPPSSVKYSAGGPTQIGLTQGLVLNNSALGYRISSCALWEILPDIKAPTHALYVTAPRENGVWVPRLSVTQTMSTQLEDFNFSTGWVAGGASNSLMIKGESGCQFDATERDLKENVFQFKKPSSPTGFATCVRLFSTFDKSVLEHQNNWGDTVFFPNPHPRRIRKLHFGFPTTVTIVQCRNGRNAESAGLRGYEVNGGVVFLASLMLLIRGYAC